MSGASKSARFVMPYTSNAMVRRLNCAGAHASALHCDTNGLQQFVIEQKYDCRGHGLGSTGAVSECGRLVGALRRQVNLFATRNSR
jgi:hypothetical protein